MELIDRYVHAVGQHLPAKLRADVEAELRSLLLESLDERTRAGGGAPPEALARDVVREFGSPREVAARYAQGPQYLIGPPLYPVFITVLKIQLAVVAGISLFMLVTGRYLAPGEPATVAVFANAGASFVGGVVNCLGITTLIFALIELAIRRQPGGDATWDPSKLPAVDDPDRVSYFGRIVTLYFLAVAAVVFNFYPEWVGILMVTDAGPHVVPLLEPAFQRYLPFMNTGWALALVLNLVVLRDGHWRRASRWCEVGLDVFSAAILAAIVAGPPVFRYDHYVKLALAVVLAVTFVTAGVRIFKLLRAARRPEPWLPASAK